MSLCDCYLLPWGPQEAKRAKLLTTTLLETAVLFRDLRLEGMAGARYYPKPYTLDSTEFLRDQNQWIE